MSPPIDRETQQQRRGRQHQHRGQEAHHELHAEGGFGTVVRIRRIEPEPEPRWRPFAVGAEDVRQFLMAYCACLLAAVTFIW